MKPVESAPPTALELSLNGFRDWYAATRHSPDHIARTMRALRTIANACGWRDVRDVTKASLLQHLTTRIQENQITPKTADNLVGQVGAWCQWAVDVASTIPENPIKHAPRFDRTPQDRGEGSRVATTQEIRALIVAAEADEAKPPKSRRFKADRSVFYLCLAHTGLRYGSGQKLRWRDVMLNDAIPHIILPAGMEKTRTRRDIPLTTELAAKLVALRSLAKPRADSPIFGFVHDRVLAGDLEAAGVPKNTEEGPFGFHSLRKWCATTMAEEGVPISIAAEVLGHSNPATTMRHYQRAGRERRANAVAQLPTLDGVMQNLEENFQKVVDAGVGSPNTEFVPSTTQKRTTPRCRVG